MKHIFTRDDMVVAFDKGFSKDNRKIFLGELEALFRVRNKQAQEVYKLIKKEELVGLK